MASRLSPARAASPSEGQKIIFSQSQVFLRLECYTMNQSPRKKHLKWFWCDPEKTWMERFEFCFFSLVREKFSREASFAQVLFSPHLTLTAQIVWMECNQVRCKSASREKWTRALFRLRAQMTHRKWDFLFRDLELIQESFSSQNCY